MESRDPRVPDLRPGEMAVPVIDRRADVSALAAATPTRIDVPEMVRTERMVLRPLLSIDRGPFLDLVRTNAAHLSPWVPIRDGDETEDAYFDRQLALCADGDANGSAWRRVGVLDDGQIVGMFNLNAITRGLSWEADAAWWLGRAFTGRGLATEGVRTMLRHALEMAPAGLGLFAVHCGIAPENEVSRRLAERCGFVHQPGKHSYLKVGGRWAYHEFFLCSGLPEDEPNRSVR
ncbi:MAG: GNAT family protein [Planctomycetota bacterium]